VADQLSNGGHIRPSSNYSGEIAVGFYDTSGGGDKFYWLTANGSSVLWNQNINLHPDNGVGLDIDNYGSRTIYAGVRTGSASGSCIGLQMATLQSISDRDRLPSRILFKNHY